jgi:hypothetical protein
MSPFLMPSFGHDMGYPLAPIEYWLDRLFVWTDRLGSFGSSQTDALPATFIHGLQALFVYLTGSLQLAQKLDFIFWFSIPGVTMYILLRSLHPEKENYLIRMVGSVFYMLNLYLLQAWIIAEMSKFSLVAVLPLVILAVSNVLMKNGSIVKNSLLVGLATLFLNGGAGIPLWGGLFMAVFAFYISVLFLQPKNTRLKKIIRSIGFLIFTSILFILLNLYWLFPYLSAYKQNFTDRIGAAGGREGITAWSREISKHASFTNLFKLQGIPDLYDNPDHPYAQVVLNNPLFIIISILFPVVLFSNFLTLKLHDPTTRIYVFAFFAILIIALPFVAGSHPPLGSIYDLLLSYIPGFSIFRTPIYKFGMALWFSYSYLFAFGIHSIFKYLSIKHVFINKIKPYTLVFTLLLLCLYNFPAFTGAFF